MIPSIGMCAMKNPKSGMLTPCTSCMNDGTVISLNCNLRQVTPPSHWPQGGLREGKTYQLKRHDFSIDLIGPLPPRPDLHHESFVGLLRRRHECLEKRNIRKVSRGKHGNLTQRWSSGFLALSQHT
jgi:hypothetical protein